MERRTRSSLRRCCGAYCFKCDTRLSVAGCSSREPLAHAPLAAVLPRPSSDLQARLRRGPAAGVSAIGVQNGGGGRRRSGQRGVPWSGAHARSAWPVQHDGRPQQRRWWPWKRRRRANVVCGGRGDAESAVKGAYRSQRGLVVVDAWVAACSCRVHGVLVVWLVTWRPANALQVTRWHPWQSRGHDCSCHRRGC